MKGIHYFTKKEKTIFWAAALISIVGGFIGSLFSSVLWQSILTTLGENTWPYIVIIIVVGAAFAWVVNFIVKQIEKNRPIKRVKKKKTK